jgi:hypothetical protein
LAGAYPANLLDAIFCVLGGYFLQRRKSRTLAGALLIYAIYVGGVTVLGHFRIINPQGGTNIILAVIGDNCMARLACRHYLSSDKRS